MIMPITRNKLKMGKCMGAHLWVAYVLHMQLVAHWNRGNWFWFHNKTAIWFRIYVLNLWIRYDVIHQAMDFTVHFYNYHCGSVTASKAVAWKCMQQAIQSASQPTNQPTSNRSLSSVYQQLVICMAKLKRYYYYLVSFDFRYTIH